MVVLAFWSSYQRDADRLFEKLVELESRHKSRGLAVVAIVAPPWDETYIRKLLSAARPAYPVGLDNITSGPNQRRSSTFARFIDAASQSLLYVIDRKGFMRPVSDSSKIETEMETALAK